VLQEVPRRSKFSKPKISDAHSCVPSRLVPEQAALASFSSRVGPVVSVSSARWIPSHLRSDFQKAKFKSPCSNTSTDSNSRRKLTCKLFCFSLKLGSVQSRFCVGASIVCADLCCKLTPGVKYSRSYVKTIFGLLTLFNCLDFSPASSGLIYSAATFLLPRANRFFAQYYCVPVLPLISHIVVSKD